MTSFFSASIGVFATCLTLMTTQGQAREAKPGLAEMMTSHNGVLDGPFLRLLGAIEGPDGYVTVTRSTRLKPSRPITQMTISEALEFQRKIRASGASSSALGRYQFVYKTLSYVVTNKEIDPDLPFDRYTQDALARLEMRRCGFYDQIVSDLRVADCLAAVWAALPMVTGPRAGQSRYQGLAGNRALIDKDEFMATLRLRFNLVRNTALR